MSLLFSYNLHHLVRCQTQHGEPVAEKNLSVLDLVCGCGVWLWCVAAEDCLCVTISRLNTLQHQPGLTHLLFTKNSITSKWVEILLSIPICLFEVFDLPHWCLYQQSVFHLNKHLNLRKISPKHRGMLGIISLCEAGDVMSSNGHQDLNMCWHIDISDFSGNQRKYWAYITSSHLTTSTKMAPMAVPSGDNGNGYNGRYLS